MKVVHANITHPAADAHGQEVDRVYLLANGRQIVVLRPKTKAAQQDHVGSDHDPVRDENPDRPGRGHMPKENATR